MDYETGPAKKYVRILAYREWAQQAAQQIADAASDTWHVTMLNNKASGEEYGADRVDAVLAIGWSWEVKPPPGEAPILIFHPSALPRYRGGSPIQNQIINGETVSALTIFEATGTFDAGPIFWQRAFSLDGSLDAVLGRIRDASVEGGVAALDAIRDGTYATVPQPPTDGEWRQWSRRQPHEAEVTPEMLATMGTLALYNFIRCQQPPYPQAFMRGNDGSTLLLTARLPTREDLAMYGVNAQSRPPGWRDSVKAAQARQVPE